MSRFNFLNAGNLYQFLYISPDQQSIEAFKELLAHISTMCGRLRGSGNLDMYIFEITQPMVDNYIQFPVAAVGPSQLIEYQITLNRDIRPVTLYEIDMNSASLIQNIANNLQYFFNNPSNYVHFSCSDNRDSIARLGLRKIPGREILNSEVEVYPYTFGDHEYNPDNLIAEKALIQSAPEVHQTMGGGRRRKSKRRRRKLRKRKSKKNKIIYI